MISFYPGPSKTDDHLHEYVLEAHYSGILSANHRSPEFMKLYAKVVKMFKKRLKVPDDYLLVFTSSATECWEIIAQSLTTSGSYHFYNGAFGEKWFNYARKIRKNSIGYRYSPDVELTWQNLDLTGDRSVICLTQNETSNGTQVKNERISQLRDVYSEHLIAVDATSSLGGIYLDFAQADIWLASVQKCLSLPAGLGLMVLSPKAVERAREIGENDHYNSLNFILDNAEKFQTSYTPNVLDIFLLHRVLKNRKKIEKVQAVLEKRRTQLEKIIKKSARLKFLNGNKDTRSTTVFAIEATPEDVAFLKEKAEENNLKLGNGYGEWKENSFRIANFPAINASEWKKLKNFLVKYSRLLEEESPTT